MAIELVITAVIINIAFNIVSILSNGPQVNQTNLTVRKEPLFWQTPVIILVVPQTNRVGQTGIGAVNTNVGTNLRRQQLRVNQRRTSSNSNRLSNRADNLPPININ